MKIFAVLLLAFALITSAVCLKNAACGLPHGLDGTGNFACRAYFPSWTYRADKNDCIKFIYGGCGGNKNRFPVYEDCKIMCIE